MKIKIIVMASGLFMAISASENNIKTFFIRGVPFSIIRDDVQKYDHEFDVMVVGKRQQDRLQEPSFGDIAIIGAIKPVKNNVFYMLPKSSDSNSQDDSHKPFEDNAQLYQVAEHKILSCTLLEIRITMGNYVVDKDEVYGYQFVTHDSGKKQLVRSSVYEDEAIEKATIAVCNCYRIALNEALKNVATKGIALDSLSTPLGLPRTKKVCSAIFKAVLDFIGEHQETHAVSLFVKKRSEFNIYKELIASYLKGRFFVDSEYWDFY